MGHLSFAGLRGAGIFLILVGLSIVSQASTSTTRVPLPCESAGNSFTCGGLLRKCVDPQAADGGVIPHTIDALKKHMACRIEGYRRGRNIRWTDSGPTNANLGNKPFSDMVPALNPLIQSEYNTALTLAPAHIYRDSMNHIDVGGNHARLERSLLTGMWAQAVVHYQAEVYAEIQGGGLIAGGACLVQAQLLADLYSQISTSGSANAILEQGGYAQATRTGITPGAAGRTANSSGIL